VTEGRIRPATRRWSARASHVLSGSIRSQVEGEPLRVYSAGQSWTEPPNAHHLVSANASKTEPARLIAYVIADDGAEPTVYDK
jgi:quercetin dioxygenase-like cupin family protein